MEFLASRQAFTSLSFIFFLKDRAFATKQATMPLLTRSIARLRFQNSPSTSLSLLRLASIDHTPPSANIPSTPNLDPSSDPSSTSPTTASSSSTNSNPSDGTDPLVLPYHHPVPRSDAFRSEFTAHPPTHKHLNFPNPLYGVPPRNEMPEVLGGNNAQRRETVLSAITGLSPGELKGLNKVTVAVKRVVSMSKKGKLWVFPQIAWSESMD